MEIFWEIIVGNLGGLSGGDSFEGNDAF